MRTLLISFLCSLMCSVSTAGEISGRVVSIADGDTLTILDSDRNTHKIRLKGIDAPEKGQPFGQRSKENLSRLAFNRQVTVYFDKTDRYKRIIGTVTVGSGDVNLAQISSGLAWHYKEYEKEQSLSDRLRYAKEEQEARDARRGLWYDPSPVAPWDFRKSKRP